MPISVKRIRRGKHFDLRWDPPLSRGSIIDQGVLLGRLLVAQQALYSGAVEYERGKCPLSHAQQSRLLQLTVEIEQVRKSIEQAILQKNKK